MRQQITEYEARQRLHAAGIEAGEDTRTYCEIAQQFGLLATREVIEPTMPLEDSEESKV